MRGIHKGLHKGERRKGSFPNCFVAESPQAHCCFQFKPRQEFRKAFALGSTCFVLSKSTRNGDDGEKAARMGD